MYESARRSEVVAMLGAIPTKPDVAVWAGNLGRTRPEGQPTFIMSGKVASPSTPQQRAIGEIRPQMVKAVLSKGESADYLKELGECLDFARRMVGWNHDQLADALKRDKKQVGRWMRGEERTQVDQVFAVEALRAPFVIALARVANCCEEETTLRFRLRA